MELIQGGNLKEMVNKLQEGRTHIYFIRYRAGHFRREHSQNDQWYTPRIVLFA